MDIKIKMLNVGDGDAIIIYLKKSAAKQLVILIDGGHAGDAAHAIKSLDKILKDAGKKGPDLIVCTHYDADHIGGLKNIAGHYGNNIGRVWIHKPGIQLGAMRLAANVRESRTRPVGSKAAPEVSPYEKAIKKENLHAESERIVESYSQMEELVTFLKQQGIKTVEPFSGQSLPGWSQVKVLGPSKKFYKKCYDKIAGPAALLLMETRSLGYEKGGRGLAALLEAPANPCKFLDDQKKDHVTEVNQVSVILQIAADKKKYLFTGDASIESFENIPGYPDVLKNIYWLKVAHHGSHNNSSSELFDIMKPGYAYISGGDRYLDNEVRDCLKAKGAKVKTTRDAGKDLSFPV